jgi:uncharacterized protein YecT (DUF1311 family)
MSRTDFPEQIGNPYDQVDRAYERRLQQEAERPRGPDKRMLAGIGAACVLGVVGGFILKPTMEDQPAAERVQTRKVEMPTEPDGLDIIVDTRPPEPVTPLNPTLPTTPQTAPMDGYTPQPIPQPRVTVPPPVRTSQAPAQPRTGGPVMRPYEEAVRRPTPRVAARPSFNCRYARTPSERMVCVDPQLAAADRRLAQAYNQAIASGVPERVLRRQQDEWLGAREAAARYGPEDVSRVYEARISELQQMR